MEGAGPDILGGGTQHSGEAVLQLAGGLIGEGDGKNAPGSGRLNLTQALNLVGIPLAGLGVVLQKGQVLSGCPVRHFGTIRAAAVLHQVGDAVDQNGGLSAAGTGQQEKRAFGGENSLLLFGVQTVKVPGDGIASGLVKTNFLLMVKHIQSHPVL